MVSHGSVAVVLLVESEVKVLTLEMQQKKERRSCLTRTLDSKTSGRGVACEGGIYFMLRSNVPISPLFTLYRIDFVVLQFLKRHVRRYTGYFRNSTARCKKRASSRCFM